MLFSEYHVEQWNVQICFGSSRYKVKNYIKGKCLICCAIMCLLS